MGTSDFGNSSNQEATQEGIELVDNMRIADLTLLAYYDQLTKLPNRNLLNNQISELLKGADDNCEKIGVLFIDLDDFKKINDSFGHVFGDKMLIEVAKRLLLAIRSSDSIIKSSDIHSLVSRYGGDEFIVIVRNVHNKKDIWMLVDRLLEEIKRPMLVEEREITIECSIGISVYPDDGENLKDLIEKADVAMYSAKKTKNTSAFAFYECNSETNNKRIVLLEHDLRSAIEKEQFKLFFQPQVRISDGQIIGAESLLRWCHPEYGYVSPSEFIPIAEKSRYITSITQWVIKTLFQKIADALPNLKSDFVFSFNVSSQDFLEESFPTYLVGIAEHFHIPTNLLCIEVTESLIMEDVDRAVENMQYLAANNFQIAIDDFGTGHSSFSYLHRFPIHKLKIDRAFIQSLSENTKSHIIVQSLIAMCHQLNIEVIAEGVETLVQVQALRDMNCLIYQGFVFSKPIPINRLDELADPTKAKLIFPERL